LPFAVDVVVGWMILIFPIIGDAMIGVAIIGVVAMLPIVVVGDAVAVLVLGGGLVDFVGCAVAYKDAAGAGRVVVGAAGLIMPGSVAAFAAFWLDVVVFGSAAVADIAIQ